MVVFSRCAGSLALVLTGAAGARVSRKRGSGTDSDAPGAASTTTAFIAGVPVLNYDTAYGGEPHAQTDEQEWVVMLRPGTTKPQMQELCAASARGRCNLLAGARGGTPFVELRATEGSLEAALRAAKGAARYVEPDATVAMIPEIEGDAPEAATWGLNRVGADRRGGRAGAGATIYVLDTGVRVTHQEFSGRAAPALDLTVGTDPVECDSGDLDCARDRDGHGTHCAGTAAGSSLGVAPAASVRAIKVLGDGGSGSWSWSYYALGWMAEQQEVRPAVASMSLGGRGGQQAMVDAVNGAVNAGVTVVVAGGNDNADACNYSPAFVPSAITVGSTTAMDVRSDFSNFGPCTDLWAPGSNIWSAAHTTDKAERLLSGTSMACPHVSGAAALLLEADPSMKASAVKRRLLEGAIRDVITDLGQGDTNALLYVGEGGPPAPVPTPAPLCPPEFSTGPDWDDDCTCLTGLACHENGTPGCTYSFTAARGTKSDKFFATTCTGCRCERR